MRIETTKVSPVRLTFTIIAVILTVFFVPFMLVFPLGGGVVYSIVSIDGSSDLADIIESDNFSDNFYKIAMNEVKSNLEDENDIQPDAWQDFIKEVVSTDDISEIVHSVAEALRTGEDMDYDLSGWKENYQEKAKEMEEKASEDLYQAVVYEKDSKYFSTTCVLRARTAILRKTGFSSIDEVKNFYFSMNREDVDFDGFMRAQWDNAKEEFSLFSDAEVIEKMDEYMALVEEKVDEIQSDLHREPATNAVLTMLKNGKLMYVIVYGMIGIGLLVLLLMYWFAPGACITLGVFSVLSFTICELGSAIFMGRRQEYWINSIYDSADVGEEYRIFTKTIQRILEMIASRTKSFGIGMAFIGAGLIVLGILLIPYKRKKKLRAFYGDIYKE